MRIDRKPEASPLRAVLFDLDGTLVDTAPDLASALNQLRAEHGMAPLPIEVIRGECAHGANELLHLAFLMTPDQPAFPQLRARFLALYHDTGHRGSRLFPGMDEALAGLSARGLKWGIVTNKPARFTDDLVRVLGLQTPCVVSGDTTPFSKPHPAPMEHAARLLDVDARSCVFIGDAERDIIAGRRANMRTLVARFGYLRTGDEPERWGADGALDSAHDLLPWLDQQG